MKKGLLSMLIAVTMLLGFNSCNSDDDDAPAIQSYVNVTVRNLAGELRPGTDVYLFKNTRPVQTTNPNTALKMERTNNNGVAGFTLNLSELGITETQTPLYFAVFYRLGTENFIFTSEEPVYVRRDETKSTEVEVVL